MRLFLLIRTIFECKHVYNSIEYYGDFHLGSRLVSTLLSDGKVNGLQIRLANRFSTCSRDQSVQPVLMSQHCPINQPSSFPFRKTNHLHILFGFCHSHSLKIGPI